MAELTLADRLRTAHVSRWQIVRVARQQTLAEHLYLVREWTNAMSIAAGFNKTDRDIAEQWALEHDTPEVITGDLATPFKAMMREAVPHDNPIRRIELELSASYASLYSVVKHHCPHVQVLVKMADTVEAVAFLALEGIGPHAKTIQRELWGKFLVAIDGAVNDHPTYDWQNVYLVATQQTGG